MPEDVTLAETGASDVILYAGACGPDHAVLRQRLTWYCLDCGAWGTT